MERMCLSMAMACTSYVQIPRRAWEKKPSKGISWQVSSMLLNWNIFFGTLREQFQISLFLSSTAEPLLIKSLKSCSGK